MQLELDSDLTRTSIIGVDWGTSNFRLLFIDERGCLISEQSSDHGFGQINRKEATGFLEATLSNVSRPIVMCGMVGSSIGLKEVPYVDCPVSAKTLSMQLVDFKSGGVDALIVPGVRFYEKHQIDVMRGEETQIVGWISTQTHISEQQICLPGTHSKWVSVKNGSIQRVETALTGELYQLLSTNSVLVVGEQQFDDQEFAEGVKHGATDKDLIRKLFSVRSRVVAGNSQAKDAASYLSGLLIGAELGSREAESFDRPLHLVAETNLGKRYAAAAQLLEIPVQVLSGTELVAAGLHQLWSLYEQS